MNETQMLVSVLIARFTYFNVEKFLEASTGWNAEIKRLKEKLNNVSELPAIQSSGVQTSNTSDLTARQAIDNANTEMNISVLEAGLKLRDWAFNMLTPSDQELIRGFFYENKRKKSFFVEDYGREHCLCRTDVYKRREEAIENFRDIIAGKYDI